MLLCLLTGQRCQTLIKLDITLMQVLPGKIVFIIGEKLKTARPGKNLEPIELLEYPQDESLCVISHLKQYIKCLEQLQAAKTHNCSSVIPSCTNQSPIPLWVNGLKVSIVKQALTTAHSPVTVPGPHQLHMAPAAASPSMPRHLLSIITHRSKGTLEPAYLHILKTAFLSDLCLT